MAFDIKKLEAAFKKNSWKIPWRIDFYDETSSTNDVAIEKGKQGAEEGLIIFSEKQTKGRGRNGKIWEDHKGKGICSSLILRSEKIDSQPLILTMIMGLAIVEALEEEKIACVQMKWPNDVLINGKKVGGILTEVCRDKKGKKFAVVGFGVNVLEKEEDFSEAIHHRATSILISSGGKNPLEREELFLKILQKIEKYYTEDFSKVRELWSKRCVSSGEFLKVKVGEEVLRGVAIGVNNEGALLLQLESGDVRIIFSGDVLSYSKTLHY